jgi:HD-GYP domain-containing protein (c-di-GMP phosphodiesterase class II)
VVKVDNASLIPGMVLAKDVLDRSYTLMLSKGTVLTAEMVERLQNLEPADFFVKDLSADLKDEHEKIITQRLSAGHARVINAVSRNLKAVTENHSLDTDILKNMVDEIQSQININSNVLLNLSHIKTFDTYLFSHVVNVSVLALIIGKQLKLSDQDREDLGLAALLHDFGMVKMNNAIFDHDRKLSSKEWEEIKRHPEYSAALLKSSGSFAPDIIAGIMDHHERLDGSGYPQGKKGPEINYFGKIIAVADVYDACISPRKYRNRLTPRRALQNLLSQSHLFDLDVLRAFVAAMAIYPIGSFVRLNSGEIAKVIGCNSSGPFRPEIRIVLGKTGQKLPQPIRLNLMDEENTLLYIEETLEEEQMESIYPLLEN